MKKGSKFKQVEIGQKFGMLKVLAFSHYEKRRSHWYCECECKNIGFFSKKYLSDSKLANCGCISRLVAGSKNNRTMQESNDYKWDCIKNLSHWEGDCLIWDGYLKDKTPRMTFRNVAINVRRWIYLYYHKTIPPKLFVCSACGNYKCINIKHIRTSTNGK